MKDAQQKPMAVQISFIVRGTTPVRECASIAMTTKPEGRVAYVTNALIRPLKMIIY
jgi:hypothetical protein